MARTTLDSTITHHFDLGHAPTKLSMDKNGLWLRQGYGAAVFLGPLSGVSDLREALDHIEKHALEDVPIEKEL